MQIRCSLLSLVAASALITVGCSNDDDSSAAPTTTAAISPVRPATTVDTGDEATTTGAPPSTVDLDQVSVRLTEVATAESPTVLVPRAGTSDLYVAERPGTVRRLVRHGDRFTTDPAPVLDITDDVADLDGERGLLGLAFAADGSVLYVSYTDGNDDGASVIAAYRMGGDVADPASRREILRLAQPFSNHNGGNIVLGPDGYLWVGFGDGGSQGDPDNNGQDTTVLLAKMLRIDVSASAGVGGYTVPGDNPFVDRRPARTEIWSFGLRNPWRFSFDRATGDLWIGDVGGSEWEEIDFLPASAGNGKGANLGWSLREGAHDTDKTGDRSGTIDPIFEYSHDEGSSVTGGFVYRGARVPDLVGTYLFSDFSAATLRGIRVGAGGELAQQAVLRTTGEEMSQVSSFGQDDDGELYVLSLSGQILRLDPA